jgi:hypothetical protein
MALERGMVIRLPWWPSRASAIMTILRGLLVYVGCCPVGFWLSTKSTGTRETEVFFMLFLLLGIRCLRRFFPNMSAWISLPVLGLLTGFGINTFVNDRDSSDQSFQLRPILVTDTAILIVILGLDALRHMFFALVGEVVACEGSQLKLDTVRSAESTDEGDTLRIRSAISGTEDAIDNAIKVFKEVGRYDHAVGANIAGGMSTALAREGFKSWLSVGGCYLWTVPLLSPLHLDGGYPISTRIVFVLSFSAIIEGFEGILSVLGLRFYMDYAIFASEAIFWSGLCHHVAVGVSGFVLPLDLHHVMHDGGAANVSLYIVCCVVAVAFCVTFYKGMVTSRASSSTLRGTGIILSQAS